MGPQFLMLPEIDVESGTGFGRTNIHNTCSVHGHTFMEFFYIVKGTALHIVNGGYQPLVPGTLVLIRSNDVHGYEFFDNNDFDMISLGFTVSEFDNAINYMGANAEQLLSGNYPPISILLGTNRFFLEKKIIDIGTKQHGSERKTYFLSIMPMLLYTFLEHNNCDERADPPRWLMETVEQMTIPENFISGLPRMLELAHVSQEHLTRVFRKFFSMTPTEFINMKRISYSIDLLSTNKYNILDISLMCGFTNLSYFYRLFKRQYGISPKKYRV